MRSTLPMLAPVVGRFIFASCMAAAAALIVASSLLAVNCYAAESSERLGPNTSASFAFSPPEAPHRHSSTYQEGVLRGQAALVRAYADLSLQDAQAEIFRAQAYSMWLDNSLKLTETHFERKRMIANYYHQGRIDRYVRKNELYQFKQIDQLKKALEYPLTEFDVNFKTGTVYWPALVAGPRYAEFRRQVDRLVGNMLQSSGVNPAEEEALATLCNKFRHELYKELLEDQTINHPAVKAEYVSASRLLKGLRYTPVVLTNAPVNMISMR
jgi:hypothetical protein